MDIPRPNAAKEKRRKRIIIAGIIAVALIGVTFALARVAALTALRVGGLGRCRFRGGPGDRLVTRSKSALPVAD